ncbi:MAG: hypothetical protein K2X60_00260, partial [Xanthobacteraceae bacterium]|nr:hypothetical protein [Xanthobacteraceae bacterium]
EAIDPTHIIGEPSEAEAIGSVQHVEEIALRLLEKLTATIPLLLGVSRQPGIDPKIVAAAHERLQIPTLIASLTSHIATLKLPRRLPPQSVVEAMLVAAHGSAFMSLASPPEHAPHHAAALRRVIKTMLAARMRRTGEP